MIKSEKLQAALQSILVYIFLNLDCACKINSITFDLTLIFTLYLTLK